MRKIAVKEIAYFICQSGNLTPEFFSNRDQNVGSELHKYLQLQYSSDDKKEYYIKQELTYENETYLLHGFIDGVLKYKNKIIIEEIKSTTKDLDELSLDYHKEHLAQLKIYSYLYALENNLDTIDLRLTYISVIDTLTRSFNLTLSIKELEDFTFEILIEYLNWIKINDVAKNEKIETLKTIKFPFEMERSGQRDLMRATYKTLKDKDILYAIAPTGIGKTMATLFSALKVLDKNDKLFYLTAKSSGKNAPLDAINILKSRGLKLKCIDIVAKKKACNAKKQHCNPDECPFAIGYFDRLKDATIEIFKDYDVYSEEVIKNIANKHNICAFEFSLYISYYCDVIIADYNYVFDPKAQLIRYFQDDTYNPKVLVDEAHNLINRSKEMYSANLNEIDIRSLRANLNSYKPSIRSDCNKIIEIINEYRTYLADKATYVDNNINFDLHNKLKALLLKCDQILEENKKIPNKDEILEVYFKIMDFNRISEYYNDKYRTIIRLIDDNIYINYFCMDASDFILDIINTSIHGIVFFSATLSPIDYHMNLLTKGNGKFIELDSPFDPNNLDLIFNTSISTKYKRRQESIDYIIEDIEILINEKPGNYIVFFPSYAYLNMVVENIIEPNYEMIIQTNKLTDIERAEIINKYKTTTNSKVGFFVMGGAFSEGIDFIGDALMGVIIVGVGLPMICEENDLLKDYFEAIYNEGFDYAYTYPGFIKVIQAVGRVIRDKNDRGVAIFIDDRYNLSIYKKIMPKHWKNAKIINNAYQLKLEIKNFNNK